MNVVSQQKDLYLYQLLIVLLEYLQNFKIFIFVNSIDLVKRLTSLLNLLLPNVTVLGIHAKLQQKSRLKILEKFSNSKTPFLLVTTDVSSRGLDIESVDSVIHYSVPKTLDDYVHRTGRSARCGKDGSSIMLLTPEDFKAKIKNDIDLMSLTEVRKELFPIVMSEQHTVTLLSDRFRLAKEIEQMSFSSTKKHMEQKGKLAQMAKAAGLVDESDDEDSRRQSKKMKVKLRELKQSLSELISMPLEGRRKGFVVVNGGLNTI
ncbi:hypothetical protein GEMRC1_003647 [Eukaryota sp. GEM-RC1]